MKTFKVGTDTPHKDIHGVELKVGDMLVYVRYSRIHLGVILRSAPKSVCVADVEGLRQYLRKTDPKKWEHDPVSVHRLTIDQRYGYSHNNILRYPERLDRETYMWINRMAL